MLDGLALLEAVVRHNGLAAGAKSLRVTVKVAEEQISELAHLLKVRLLDDQRRPTQAALTLSGPARKMLWEVSSLLELADRLADTSPHGVPIPRLLSPFPDGAEVPAAIADLRGNYVRANSAFQRLLERPLHELVGLDFRAVTFAGDVEADEKQDEILVAARTQSATRLKSYVTASGEVVAVRVTSSLVHTGTERAFLVIAEPTPRFGEGA